MRGYNNRIRYYRDAILNSRSYNLVFLGLDRRSEERARRKLRERHRGPDDPVAGVLRQGVARRHQRLGHRRGGHRRDIGHAQQLRSPDHIVSLRKR